MEKSNIEIVNEFTELIQSCLGQVTFVTAEGDRLVTDSMLSALVGFASLISVAGSIDVHFECENPEDCERLRAFMAKYHLGEYRGS
jgi:hypothetical protein